MFVEALDTPIHNFLGTCAGFTHYFQSRTLCVKYKLSYTSSYNSVQGLNMEKYRLKN